MLWSSSNCAWGRESVDDAKASLAISFLDVVFVLHHDVPAFINGSLNAGGIPEVGEFASTKAAASSRAARELSKLRWEFNNARSISFMEPVSISSFLRMPLKSAAADSASSLAPFTASDTAPLLLR